MIKLKSLLKEKTSMDNIYDDIELAIKRRLELQYYYPKYGKNIKSDIPIEILSGPSTAPYSIIKFKNGDKVKDFEIIGLHR